MTRVVCARDALGDDGSGVTPSRRSARDEQIAVSAMAAEEAAETIRHELEAAAKLQREKERKQQLWEDELQKELQFQKAQKASSTLHAGRR